MTVAEIDVPEKDLHDYVGEHGYFSMVFDFSIANLDIDEQPPFTLKPITGKRLKPVFIKSQLDTQRVGWGAPYLENHDQPRSLNKFLPKGTESSLVAAKMLATFLLMQRGTPFIYQGQEIGMTNCAMSIDEYDDLHVFKLYEWGLQHNYDQQKMMSYFAARSRDNARTPFQWNSDLHAGFTSASPWLKINPNYTTINAQEQQQQADSLFSFYQQLISLRLHSEIRDILIHGTFIALEAPENVIAYRRVLKDQWVNIYCNFNDKNEKVNSHINKLYLSNIKDLNIESEHIVLNPYQAIIFK